MRCLKNISALSKFAKSIFIQNQKEIPPSTNNALDNLSNVHKGMSTLSLVDAKAMEWVDASYTTSKKRKTRVQVQRLFYA